MCGEIVAPYFCLYTGEILAENIQKGLPIDGYCSDLADGSFV